jgi:DNA-binding XRE family transcriptional regulator
VGRGARRQRGKKSSAATRRPEFLELKGTLADRICQLRDAFALKQEEAAELAWIDTTTWQAIESGDNNVTLASTVGIALALGVSISQLFHGIGPRPRRHLPRAAR